MFRLADFFSLSLLPPLRVPLLFSCPLRSYPYCCRVNSTLPSNPRPLNLLTSNTQHQPTHSVLTDESAGKSGDLYIRSVCFSPDGKYLATGAEDKQIRVSFFVSVDFLEFGEFRASTFGFFVDAFFFASVAVVCPMTLVLPCAVSLCKLAATRAYFDQDKTMATSTSSSFLL